MGLGQGGRRWNEDQRGQHQCIAETWAPISQLIFHQRVSSAGHKLGSPKHEGRAACGLELLTWTRDPWELDLWRELAFNCGCARHALLPQAKEMDRQLPSSELRHVKA